CEAPCPLCPPSARRLAPRIPVARHRCLRPPRASSASQGRYQTRFGDFVGILALLSRRIVGKAPARLDEPWRSARDLLTPVRSFPHPRGRPELNDCGVMPALPPLLTWGCATGGVQGFLGYGSSRAMANV